jgi:flagellar assembly protein FliH
MLRQVKDIQPMQYRAVVSGLAQITADCFPEGSPSDRPAKERADLEARVLELIAKQQQSERAFQNELSMVRRDAYEAGRKSSESEQSAAMRDVSERLTALVEEFRQGRDRYLAQVEKEVVRLALAIAERILHREAQMDPLFLSGVVRVALGQLADSTEVRLRVPLKEQEMWAEMLRLMPNLPLRPELKVDERMNAGDCTIETHLGSVDIGVRAQLAEIERGFFDLLGQREQASPGPSEVAR